MIGCYTSENKLGLIHSLPHVYLQCIRAPYDGMHTVLTGSLAAATGLHSRVLQGNLQAGMVYNKGGLRMPAGRGNGRCEIENESIAPAL